MSTLILTLKQGLNRPVDMSAVKPSALAGLTAFEISSLVLGSGATAVALGDVFDVSGAPDSNVTISGGSSYLDYVGAGLDSGSVTVDGPVGNYAGTAMKGGRLDIRGDAGAYLASRMSGGIATVKGNAGDFVGGTRPGDRFGMTGGIVVIEGDIGARAGDKMRRGTVIVKGKAGPGAGTRMIGGTIWAEGGFGADPGLMMRRGTLIGSKVERLLPTFSDCGKHDLVIVRVLNRYLKQTLGDLAPKPLPLMVQRIAGDMATIGKGEILLPG